VLAQGDLPKWRAGRPLINGLEPLIPRRLTMGKPLAWLHPLD
jgi:hypothetical protein